MINRI